MKRAENERLDRVVFDDRSHATKDSGRTPPAVEADVLAVRRELREQSALGEYGALAIHDALVARSGSAPSTRTIGRILERNGALDGARRVRRAPPPLGWYLPTVASRQAELDSFDAIVGLVIKGGVDVEVLTGVSLLGGLVGSWTGACVTASFARDSMIAHWKEVGLPAFAQFDNDTRFQGPHQHKDTFGSVTRLCLDLCVVPVFTPPKETGFQAAVEAQNGRWQSKVWSRFHHDSLEQLEQRNRAYVAAHRQRARIRIESAPPRRPFPRSFSVERVHPLRGRIVYLRRTDDSGNASLLGHRFQVDRNWPHRLVRAEFDLDEGVLRFYALRRADPTSQPLLREIVHRPPRLR